MSYSLRSHVRGLSDSTCLLPDEYLRRQSTSETQREGHEDEIISMVRVSLVDDEAIVRSAAAKAFDMLQEYIGAKAIDQTIPTLLEALRQPGQSSGTALQALREVMNVRPSPVSISIMLTCPCRSVPRRYSPFLFLPSLPHR